MGFQSYRLSDALHVKEVEGDAILLYTPTADDVGEADPRAAKMVLTTDEQAGLFNYLTDGYCPICGTAINLGAIICLPCYEQAKAYFRGFGED